MYLRFLGIGIGGEENQSKGEDGEDLHCSLFDGEVVVEVAVVVVTIVWEDTTPPCLLYSEVCGPQVEEFSSISSLNPGAFTLKLGQTICPSKLLSTDCTDCQYCY